MPGNDRPILIYDGECHLCRRWVARWRARTGERVDYAPFQEVAGRFPGIPRDRFKAAIHFVGRDGRVSVGAEAVFRALACAPRGRWLLLAYETVPGAARAAEVFYRFVARHRGWISTWTRRF